LSRPFDKALGRKADPQGESFTIKGLREPERPSIKNRVAGSLISGRTAIIQVKAIELTLR